MALPATFDISSEKSDCKAGGLSLLEQLAVSAKKRCKNPNAPVLFGEHKEDDIAIVIKTRCKQWSCPQCGARNARRAIATVLNHVNNVDRQFYFMTLTAHEKFREPESSRNNLQAGFEKLVKRMKRAFPDFEYFRTYEPHEDGSFHMHLITDVEIPYTSEELGTGKMKYRCRWLKDNARECGLGYMVDYQPLEHAGYAAHYAAKYMHKSMADGHLWLENMRRYSTSSGWTKLPDLTEATEFHWTYMHGETELWFKCYEAKDKALELYGWHGQKMMPHEIMKWYQETKQLTRDHKSVIGFRPVKPFYENRTLKRKYLSRKSDFIFDGEHVKDDFGTKSPANAGFLDISEPRQRSLMPIENYCFDGLPSGERFSFRL